MQTLKTVTQDNIVIITLNRADKKNAMNFQMMHELIQTAKTIRADKSIRGVILRGETDFCSGLDLSVFNSPTSMLKAGVELIKPTPGLFQKTCLVWQKMPVPVIAVIDGVCLGAGLQLAMGADIRICTPTAKLSILEGKWGLVFDMGLLHTAKGVRPDRLKELAMSAKIIDGQAAHAFGLVSHVDDEPLSYALGLMREFHERSPDAILASKRLVNAMHTTSRCELYQEKYWQLKLIMGHNRKRAIQKAKDASVPFLKRQFG